jgi:hypothetical protein
MMRMRILGWRYKMKVTVAHVWKSTTLSPHILTISQDVGVELMQREKHDEIN